MVRPTMGQSVGTSSFVQRSTLPNATHILAGQGLWPSPWAGLTFGGVNLGPIPQGSDIVTIPGLFSEPNSVRPLAQYFRKHLDPKGKVWIVKVPGIVGGKDLVETRQWLTNHVNETRLTLAQTRIQDFVTARELQDFDDTDGTEERQWLQEWFHTASTPSGEALTKGIQEWLNTEEPLATLHSLLTLSSGKNHQGVHTFLREWKKLHHSLSQALESHLPGNAPPWLGEKWTNAVLDQLAPRLVLVGHSLGGVMSYLAMVDDGMADVAMVVAIASPLRGTETIPEAVDKPFETFFTPSFLKGAKVPIQEVIRWIIDYLRPAIPQLRHNSAIIRHLQEHPRPLDTTLVSVGAIGDTLVIPGKDTSFDHQRPAQVHIQVQGDEGNVLEFFSNKIKLLLTPYYLILNLADSFKGLRHHAGIVHPKGGWSQSTEDKLARLWGDGRDIDRLIYEAVDNNLDALQALLTPENYEPVRQETLDEILKRLTQTPQKEAVVYAQRISPLRPLIQQLTQEPQWQENGVAQTAQRVFTQLNAIIPSP